MIVTGTSEFSKPLSSRIYRYRYEFTTDFFLGLILGFIFFVLKNYMFLYFVHKIFLETQCKILIVFYFFHRKKRIIRTQEKRFGLCNLLPLRSYTVPHTIAPFSVSPTMIIPRTGKVTFGQSWQHPKPAQNRFSVYTPHIFRIAVLIGCIFPKTDRWFPRNT